MRLSMKWRIMQIKEGVGQDRLHPLELSIILQIVQKLNPIIVIIYYSFKIIASFKTS